jgi:hypothetical protein
MLGGRCVRNAVVGATALFLVGGSLLAAAPAGAAGAPVKVGGASASHLQAGQLTRAATTHPSWSSSAPVNSPQMSASAAAAKATLTMPFHNLDANTLQGAPKGGGGGGGHPIPPINCEGGYACNSISTSNGGATTNKYALAATANDQKFPTIGDVEPPDQMMCAGNGYVMEGINIGDIQVFNANVRAVSGITTFDTLMGLTALGDSSGGDPMCIYDPQNGGHWFLEEIVSISSEANGGTFAGCFAATYDSCREGLAVSTTNNPLATSWNVYFVDPNKINPGDPGAGYLLNDFSKLGNSRDALMMFYDEFPLRGPLPSSGYGSYGFNGAQELAIQKKALELGYASVNFVHENMGTDPYIQPPDGACYQNGIDCWYTVIPQETTGTQFDNNYGGTGFMAGTMDFIGWTFGTLPSDPSTGNNRIAIFYWTGLDHLNSLGCAACDQIRFGGQFFTGLDWYTDQGVACPASQGNPCGLGAQRLGTLDLGTWCATVPSSSPLAKNQPCPEGGLNTNDDGVYQLSYGGGNLWFSINTLVNELFGNRSEIHLGAAYFVVGTSQFTGAQQLLSLTSQGYVAASHEDIEFPTLVGSTSSSSALMSFTLSGNGGPTRADGGGYFPTSAYGLVTASQHGLIGQTIYVSALGRAPQDGFSEYQGLPGPTRPRWGDYGAAVFVPGKGFYFASEYIQYANCNPSYWYYVDPTCGGHRDPFANFGTSISRLG